MPTTQLRHMKPELFPDREDEDFAYDSDGINTDMEAPLIQTRN